jgi:acetyl-CoA C-acetyltransferase
MVPIEFAGRRPILIEEDEGVRPVDREAIGKLPTVAPDGFHTFATQTHPADGCAGALVTSSERARELAQGAGIVRLLATGTSRVAKTHMPEAPVPAAYQALEQAGFTFDDIHLVNTHNPFAVNDLYFSQQTGFQLDRMNVRGSSLVFGHPQAPTGLRSIAELAEALRQRGGGLGLFTGCAAGDTGMAIVVEVLE